MPMTPLMTSAVMHFGEMGNRWGFNRTVGQMLALIVLSEAPVSAQEIADDLNISRGNVSMGLKELQSWRLVKPHLVPGERKDFFIPAGSVWELANRVFEERRKREIDPTLSLLRDLLLDAPANTGDSQAQRKLTEIHDLLEAATSWSEELQALGPDKLQTLMKLGAGVGRMLELKDKLLPGKSSSN
ncbi:MarR family transcriptional regulator [Alteromonas aestuariivivens]|uniref:HTH-type transcriptional regulator n=1 Tax=Alteromonas aestuariivivens TaxID=1938339 RepID=A0A3D8M9S3_9ALTE|nr:MarR family transcriptional regulator [Alteromonas aestuariivivens]RDV26614.1 MarR family transcriptional regulator [Alteromonas aestuariivivens]